MPKLRVHNFSISLDGYGAGPGQNLENPLGVGGQLLHEWVFATETGRQMLGTEGGTTGIDNAFLERRTEGIGATIMGRNMFGPIRGGWGDDHWKGWWGDDPPYHAPVFVLTHHEREPLEMQSGTTFHFVTGGPDEALRLAIEAAGDGTISVAGGASTINRFLRDGHIDELRLHLAPIVLGSGEALFRDLKGLSFEIASSRSTSLVTHVILKRVRG
jgi:dihydrofolate reductase